MVPLPGGVLSTTFTAVAGRTYGLRMLRLFIGRRSAFELHDFGDWGGLFRSINRPADSYRLDGILEFLARTEFDDVGGALVTLSIKEFSAAAAATFEILASFAALSTSSAFVIVPYPFRVCG